MKYLGYVDISKININRKYDELFPPLSEAEYNDLFNDIIKTKIIYSSSSCHMLQSWSLKAGFVTRSVFRS